MPFHPFCLPCCLLIPSRVEREKEVHFPLCFPWLLLHPVRRKEAEHFLRSGHRLGMPRAFGQKAGAGVLPSSSEGCRATSSLSGTNPVVKRRFCHLGEAGGEIGKRPVTPCGVPDRRATEPDESLKPPQLCFSITQCLSLSLSLLVQFLGGFLMDFINSLLSLPSQSEVSWYYCISCAVAHAVIQADDCAKHVTAV